MATTSEAFDFAHGDPRGRLVEELRRQVSQWEVPALCEEAAFSSGVPQLDPLLPGGALRYGMLIEWLGGKWSREEEQKWSRAEVEQGSGKAKQQNKSYSTTPLLHYSSACTLSLLAAREACRQGGVLVVIDRQQTFYPPAAAAWGIDLDRLITVRPRGARDEQWAVVQALRSPAVAAVWAAIDRLDSRAFRRLQLAAQAGHTLGTLVRPPSARGQPSWADITLEASPLSVVHRPLFECNGPRTTDHGRRCIQICISRCHGGRPGATAMLEIDDAAYTVREVTTNHDALRLPVVTELADPAATSFSARA